MRISLKQRAVAALKALRECQNFWVQLRYWKATDALPSRFSVLVQGPPHSGKTKLLNHIKALWPACTAKEGTDQRLTWMRDHAGYDLVFKTGRGVRQFDNGLSVEWRVVTVEKNRIFSPRGRMAAWQDEETGEINEDWQPHMYDLP